MKSKGSVKAPSRDAKKDKIFKVLSDILSDSGFTVRREELKRGFGWKAVSGTCRVEDSKIIFVDRRTSQEDQLSFLTSKILTLGIAPAPEQLAILSELGWSFGAQKESSTVLLTQE